MNLETHSFDPSTLVLMADGSTRPISEVNVGDRVTTTDPVTGEHSGQQVTLLHANRDTELTDVTVSAKPAGQAARSTGEGEGERSTRGPTQSVLHTTAHHPFWNATTGEWVDAADLTPGESTLVGPDGQIQYVAAVRSFTGAKVMRDLTVAITHTYYVIAGDDPVLVHNNNCERIDYGSINEHGQRSGVRALLDEDNIGGSTAPNPEEAIPSLRPGGLDNQTHLLAAMLGGSNTDPRNFVAMYRRANNPRMLAVEYAIRKAVKGGKQQVQYSAVPKYIGTSSRPLYIHIRAVGSGPDPLMVDVKIWNVNW